MAPKRKEGPEIGHERPPLAKKVRFAKHASKQKHEPPSPSRRGSLPRLTPDSRQGTQNKERNYPKVVRFLYLGPLSPEAAELKERFGKKLRDTVWDTKDISWNPYFEPLLTEAEKLEALAYAAEHGDNDDTKSIATSRKDNESGRVDSSTYEVDRDIIKLFPHLKVHSAEYKKGFEAAFAKMCKGHVEVAIVRAEEVMNLCTDVSMKIRNARSKSEAYDVALLVDGAAGLYGINAGHREMLLREAKEKLSSIWCGECGEL